MCIITSPSPGSVQFVPQGVAILASQVAGGQVQDPGLSVHHLEAFRVHLVDAVSRAEACVACNTEILRYSESGRSRVIGIHLGEINPIPVALVELSGS